MNNVEILEKIRNAGVIGAGGAGFPTYKKLEAQVEYIIANGAECEPLLYKDRESMLLEMEQLFSGLSIMRKLTGAKEVVIALKEKNRDIAEQFEAQAREKDMRFFVYKDVYPAGDEYVLIYEITGRRVPPGGLPFQIGCVVDNTETILNLAKAVKNIPVTEKYITITGAVKDPLTTLVPVGISLQKCIDLAGGTTVEKPAALMGGVMMGNVEKDFSKTVSKTLGGIIVLPEDHYLIKRKTTPREIYTRIGHGQCDQCSMCTEMCPRYILGYPIEPHKVMRNLLMTSEAKRRASLWAQYCVECNICTFIACPEGLDPKSICVDAKELLRMEAASRTEEELKALSRDVHPMRSAREVPIKTVYRRLGLLPYDRAAYFKETDPQPSSLSIPLNSHIGEKARAKVEVGERVKKGQVIAEVAPEALGCPVHASLEGQISKITDDHIIIKTQ